MALFPVLTRSVRSPHSYCQGMGFLVAVMLCYVPAESAFWLLVSVMQHPEYAMRRLFMPGMPRFAPAMARLGQLLEQTVPEVARHLVRVGVEPAMFASQWFMTLFAYNFPLPFVARVWDLFLAQGWAVVFRVALALVALERDVLPKLSFEAAMIRLRDIPARGIEVDKVVAHALLLHVPDATLLVMPL